jgi:hypothetical protein
MDQRKEYMKKIYSKYWVDARDSVYGFMDYDRAVIELIDCCCIEIV